MSDELNSNAFYKGSAHGEEGKKPKPPKHPERAQHYFYGYKTSADKDSRKALKEHEREYWKEFPKLKNKNYDDPNRMG